MMLSLLITTVLQCDGRASRDIAPGIGIRIRILRYICRERDIERASERERDYDCVVFSSLSGVICHCYCHCHCHYGHEKHDTRMTDFFRRSIGSIPSFIRLRLPYSLSARRERELVSSCLVYRNVFSSRMVINSH